MLRKMVKLVKLTTPTKPYKSRYADNKQSELYTKFPTTHFLGNPQNVDHVLKWCTFFRRNLHRVATDYLGLKLHMYQVLVLYLMGICKTMVIVAARSAAKSFIIAIYACCVCIVYPYSEVVLTSATKKQAKLIVSAKIQQLQNFSPVLRKEITKIKDNQNEVIVFFRSGSTITVVPANENGRGYRSNFAIREEFRQIKKNIEDSVIAPFQVIRQVPYMVDPYYADMPVGVCIQDSVDVYISSSWLDPHWMWTVVDNAYESMLDGTGQFLIAFDESIVLKHKIKSQDYYQKEKKKQDRITWECEFLNVRIKENQFAFFTYKMFNDNQHLKQVFYPRTTADFIIGRKNPYAISKQKGEIRLIGADLSFVTRKGNDRSVFTCMRLLPETKRYKRSEMDDLEVSGGYRRIVPYMESLQGGEISNQAQRLRQLYEDFEADYIVLDCRNAGIAVYDCLARVMYDEERKVEYSPLKCMNDEAIADRIQSEGALECIYAINASQKLNSDIALDFLRVLEQEMINFLIPYESAQDEILSQNDNYLSTPDADVQFFYESPFLETQALITECIELSYEKKESGIIVVKEGSTSHKDRYSSCSYASYVATLFEKDLFSVSDDYAYGVYIN